MIRPCLAPVLLLLAANSSRSSWAFAPCSRTLHVSVHSRHQQQHRSSALASPIGPKSSSTPLSQHRPLYAASSSFKIAAPDKSNLKSLASAAAFCVIDILFRRLFAANNIAFPSSLAACSVLFATLLALPGGTGEKLCRKALSPGALLLAKWLPVFFVPSLVALPLTQNLGPPVELIKVAGVLVGCFFGTLLSTAYAVVLVRQLKSNAEVGAPVVDAVVEASTTVAQSFPKPKAFSDELFNLLSLLTVSTGVGACFSAQISPLFFLSTTLTAFCFGARQDPKFTKLVHPLVTCTALTWTVMAAFCALTGKTFKAALKGYTTKGAGGIMNWGAGDVLLSLLGPAVVSLAISMYERRKLVKENLAEVGTGIAVSTLGGLFGTAVCVRWADIISPYLRLSLLSRNITSPLAMAIAGIVGADISLAVSMVVVTGLIGANFGASILDAFGIKDAVARGLGIGAAAHGLGTAAFVSEKDAFPFAAISMALTATAATVTVSIPFFRKLLLQLALGA